MATEQNGDFVPRTYWSGVSHRYNGTEKPVWQTHIFLVPIFVFMCSLHNEWNIRAALPGGLFVRKYDRAIIDCAKVVSPSA